MGKTRTFSALIATALAAGTAFPALAQGVSGLLPHRAVYNLELQDASEKAGISAMYGRMVYEFTGSECDGYKVNFRFVTQSDVGGEKKVSDQQSTTFEDLRNGRFEFESRSYTDDRLDKEVQGHAEDQNDKLSVELTSPTEKQVELQAGRFPTEHMIELLKRIQKGDHFFEARVFDGSDSGDKTVFTTTVMGSPTDVQPGDPDAAFAGKLKADKTWPVTIAYFNDDAGGADATPTYRMSFKLYPNGVSRDLVMDYGDFALTGRLVKLDFLPETACKPAQ